MTRTRIALLSLLLSVGAPARALADAPDAGVEHPWLAHRSDEKPAIDAAPKSTGMVRSLAATALLAGLGGSALFFRKRRGRAPVLATDYRIDVLGSTRVGPKALAVVAHVGGRTLLLGVTDSTVQRLAWLDEDGGRAREEDDDRLLERDEIPTRSAKPPTPSAGRRVATEAAPEPPSAAPSFKDVLSRWTRPERAKARNHAEPPSAASIVADATRDVFSRRDQVIVPSGRSIEGQARGLAARLQGRVV